MNKIFLLLTLCLTCRIASAALVSISGSAESYKNQVVAVFETLDYISQKRALLQTAEVNANGRFLLTFEVNETMAVTLVINRVEALMYVEPSASYNVVFPSDLTASIKRFDRTEVDLEFVDMASNDLNVLVRDFNADYISFISEHYYDFAAGEYGRSDSYLNKLGDKIKKSDLYKSTEPGDSARKAASTDFVMVVSRFSASCSEKYKDGDHNEFFDAYLDYSLAELQLLSGMNRQRFYNSFFMSRPILWKNQAYMNCFNLFYNHFLLNRSKEIQSAIVKAINTERDPEKLITVLATDSSALSVKIRTLAIVKGLYEIYNDKAFNRSAIEKVLNNISADDPKIVAVAQNTLQQIRKRKEGWQLEDFTLIDDGENKWTLSEHTGVNVYLLFFASWNPTSIKEMQVMQRWFEKYGNDVLFVAICMDDNYDDFKKYLIEHKDQKFRFLFGGKDPSIVDKCSIRSIPYALMLDETGRTKSAVTRLPSEGIQLELDKIFLVNQSKPKGPKSWKD